MYLHTKYEGADYVSPMRLDSRVGVKIGQAHTTKIQEMGKLTQRHARQPCQVTMQLDTTCANKLKHTTIYRSTLSIGSAVAMSII
jgi:hypothetical protein